MKLGSRMRNNNAATIGLKLDWTFRKKQQLYSPSAEMKWVCSITVHAGAFTGAGPHQETR